MFFLCKIIFLFINAYCCSNKYYYDILRGGRLGTETRVEWIMFGMEGQQQKKKSAEFIFELEKELKDSGSQKLFKSKIEEQMQKVRGVLRQGEGKSEFDSFGVLLHGYTSLLKVISRFSSK